LHSAPSGGRFIIQTPVITQSTPQWARRRLPGGQFPSSLVPRWTALLEDATTPGARTARIRIRNNENPPAPPATMTERLPRTLAYVPGSAQPVGGGEVNVTKARNGSTIIEWTISGPVASEPVASNKLATTFQVKPALK